MYREFSWQIGFEQYFLKMNVRNILISWKQWLIALEKILCDNNESVWFDLKLMQGRLDSNANNAYITLYKGFDTFSQ